MSGQNIGCADSQRGQQGKVSADHSDSTCQVAANARELEARRHEKIQEYLAAALDSSDILQACMGPVVCDLLEILCGLSREITEVLALDPTNPQLFDDPMAAERLANLRSSIELYWRLANQVYKLASTGKGTKQSNVFR